MQRHAIRRGNAEDSKATGLDNLLYSADADFSCFADLALTSPVSFPARPVIVYNKIKQRGSRHCSALPCHEHSTHSRVVQSNFTTLWNAGGLLQGGRGIADAVRVDTGRLVHAASQRGHLRQGRRPGKGLRFLHSFHLAVCCVLSFSCYAIG